MGKGILKEKKGGVLLRLRISPCSQYFLKDSEKLPGGPGAGWRDVLSFISWQFQKHLPYISRLQEWSRQPTLP